MRTIRFIPRNIKFESVVSTLSETQDWGLYYTGIPQAHKLTKGKDIKIAILDTGTTSHYDIMPNIIGKFSAIQNDNGEDRQGHGTHVAGVIGAAINNQGIIGVAPESKLILIKVLNDNGTGTYENIANGIKIAIEQKADIINLSLGSPCEPPAFIKSIIQEAYNKGIIIIAAAGNDGKEVNYPAKYDEVIAVAAIDKDGNLARFSSRGQKIDVSAPGVNVYSTYLNNQYAILNGTSQAAPFISGLCALILAWARENPDKLQINNTQDMLKELDKLCDPKGIIVSGKYGNIGYGIPNCANYMPWKQNNCNQEENK